MSVEALNYACQQSFDTFAIRAFNVIEPGTPYQWSWHMGCIAEHLEASYRGELPWLIINMPPRMLKSVLIAQLYPAWVLGREPHHQFIGASYAHSLAERNVMKTRQIVADSWYQSCFPRTKVSADQNQKDYFTTTQAGQYKGTGIGGTITGFGCQTLLVDDAVNPKEAASDTIRATAIDEIRSTLFSRFNDRAVAKFIMVMQRLHESDPTGDLLKDERFHLLKLPAETKTQITVSLGDKSWLMPADSVLSDRLGRKELDELRQDLTEYHYVSQYLQEPVPVGGGEFKGEWVQSYLTCKPETMNVYILVDAAGGDEVNKKKKKTSDWTVMSVVGLAPDNNYYLLDMVRDRLNPTERVEMLFILHRKWNEACGKPPKVGYEKYGMMTDTHYAKVKQNDENYRFPIIELGGKMMKEERIRMLIPDLQKGRWYFPVELPYVDQEGRRFDLVKEMRNEMASFPRARFDDILDSVSRILTPELATSFPRVTKKPLYQEPEEASHWSEM